MYGGVLICMFRLSLGYMCSGKNLKSPHLTKNIFVPEPVIFLDLFTFNPSGVYNEK